MRASRIALCIVVVLGAAPLFAQPPEVKAMYAQQAVFRARGLKALEAETAREKASSDTVYQFYVAGTVRGIAYGNCM